MRKSNKKAIMQEINPIILALIIFVILLAIFGVIIKATMRQGSEDVCLASVIAADKTSDILEIKCEMYDAGKIKPQGATDEKKKEDSMKQIAELMRKCWRQFGEGKRDPFKKDLLAIETVCFVCSRFGFEAEQSISEKEFVDFLKDTKTSKDASYHEYLKGSLTEEKGKNVFFVNSIKFSNILGIVGLTDISQYYDPFESGAAIYPNTDYGIVLYVVNQKKIPALLKYGASMDDLYVVPYTNIEKLSCDRLQG